jgi:hypothetical protein
MVNNLQKLPDGARKVIANSPALLDFMVAAYGAEHKEDFLAEIRAAASIDEAQERAKAANIRLGAVPGKTVDDVYAVTGDNASLGVAEGVKCPDGTRWDPITQTCVPDSSIPI